VKSETRNVTVRCRVGIRMTTNKSVRRLNAPQETATECSLCRFAGYCADGRTVRKRVHRVESPMEYYWKLRSKNAQNIKALTCPLYHQGRDVPPAKGSIWKETVSS